ncbi:MAG: bifunctional serine/threonine-protein kinase/formylglycine-generating enzyme family protein [Pseudanabaena sp. CAN_BIN31]|nr:bifunctional serine/threonine-protein kinase/formylglycine-generating enzyme family protein [Pseudanabaena sp. CAN_BIN31]
MSLCLACGATNPLDTKFCSQCRAKLLIQERYRALRIIGKGSFGKTFLARDEAKPSKPKCAIKQFLYDDPETLQDAKRLFEQEAVRLDDLGKHSQIPELLTHAEHEGRQYLVQEFIDGDNLKQELKLLGAFSEAKIEELLLDLLPVLQFIHAGKVIHRDIKPENIIRRRIDQKLVLVDFGAAKVVSQTAMQRTGTTIGSAGYAAPEQAFGKAIFASDTYSLGVTCLHLLTNVDPLTMYDPIEGFAWRDFLQNKKVEQDLGEILDKLTQLSVKVRYQSAREVLQILQPKSTSSQPTSSTVISQASSVSNSLVLDCGKDVELQLVNIPAGRFSMGGNNYDTEKPIHQVTLKAFRMSKYPITQKQYMAVMGNNPSNFKGNENCPVEQVSWNDAITFCKKLSQITGQNVKLPSEAQWEYACRAGSQRKYCFGDNADKLEHYAWYDKNSGSETHPVGEKLPNAWGLHDMHGNVWEWCEDVWHDNYNDAPNDGTAWLIGSGEQNRRALRGGSWCYNDFLCLSTVRDWYLTEGRLIFGFRIVV